MAEGFCTPKTTSYKRRYDLIEVEVDRDMFHDFEEAYENNTKLQIWNNFFEVYSWFAPCHPQNCKTVTIYLKHAGRVVQDNEPTTDFRIGQPWD